MDIKNLKVSDIKYKKNIKGFTDAYSEIEGKFNEFKKIAPSQLFSFEVPFFELFDEYITKINLVEDEILSVCSKVKVSTSDHQSLLVLFQKFNKLENEIIIFRNASLTDYNIRRTNRELHNLSSELKLIKTDIEHTKEDIINTKDDIELTKKDIINTKSDIDHAKDDIVKTNDEYKKNIKESESKVINHSMTYMSLLAAIIAIIASVITTSSSWLNNANPKSFSVAIIVPSLIIFLAVILLLSFCGILYPSDSKIQIICLLIFCVFSISIVIFSMCKLPKILDDTKYSTTTHTLIIIDDYEIIEKEEKYVVFKHENIIYEFIYNDELLHNDELYFCVNHNCLE